MKFKILFAFASSFFAVPAMAQVRWEIVGQDSPKAVFAGVAEPGGKTVGQLTIQLLDQHKVPYVGNEAGINSMLNTPIGDGSMVIVNDHTLRVYGWCYEVDGKIPDVMPDKFVLQDEHKMLRWFYAYSLYEKGEWKTYCTPAHTKPNRP